MEMMIDIETLDVKPTAVVLSVGAVAFERSGQIRDRFYRVLDVQKQTKLGRTVSFDTVQWWMDQEPDAQAEAFATVRQRVADVLTDLNAYCRKYDSNTYWALGPQFDYIILESLHDQMGSSVPWSHGQLRDVRTMCGEANIDRRGHGSQVMGLPHTPIYDCEFQIELLTMARGRVNRNG